MPLSRSRDYLSIGEVLESVRADFPDVSISKIRFLESEGLIEPERTPSGYRKFYEADVERLRYILSLQRDQFLPLKVIKDRLARGGSNGGSAPTPAPAAAMPPASPTRSPASTPTEVTMAADELATAAGLSGDELQGLIDFGILASDKDAYDGDDLVAAKAAAGLFRYGVEARHLKMYRNFAERERAFFEQIVSPVARRKDPDAQREAGAAIREIARLAEQFRDAILRSSMRDIL